MPNHHDKDLEPRAAATEKLTRAQQKFGIRGKIHPTVAAALYCPERGENEHFGMGVGQLTCVHVVLLTVGNGSVLQSQDVMQVFLKN